MTLLEVLVYMALFGIIFSLVVGLLIQTRDQNRKAKDAINIEQNMIFIDGHLNMVFEEVESLDANNSSFDSDQSVVALNMKDGSHVEYFLNGQQLFIDRGTAMQLSNNRARVTRFRAERVLDADDNLIGVRISGTVTSVNDSGEYKMWENLYNIK